RIARICCECRLWISREASDCFRHCRARLGGLGRLYNFESARASMSSHMLWSLGLAAAGFAAIYYPSFNRLARGLASPYAKADLGRRLSAAMVDGLLCMSTWWLYLRHGSALYLLAGALRSSPPA